MDAQPFDLDRFLSAQAPIFDTALAELRDGRKRSHWMWFVFPQMRGLGASPTSHFFGLVSLEEAQAYLAHPALGAKLRECTRAVLETRGRSLRDIFGSPDDMKFRSSMTLFSRAAGEARSEFAVALERFCDGQEDPATVTLIER